jgi:CPA2 family monovalent cation:H+ antiporter-2
MEELTLGQLAVTVTALAVLGLAASRLGLSAIPAYLLAGLLLGPNEPEVLSFVQPSAVTDFVAQLGVVFLLFFLGLEFSFDRLVRSGRHLGAGGSLDLAVNFGLGLLVGLAAFGFSFTALVLAGAIYVSSSAVVVKGLIDFRRLADDETDLLLAILVFEDVVVAGLLGFTAAGGGGVSPTLVALAKALGFVTVSVAAARLLARPIDRVLERIPREFSLLLTFALLAGMAALAEGIGLSEAIGALMAGILLAETSIRQEIEERFYAFRDLFGALFFFVFGLTIDVGALESVGWLVALAVVLTLVGKVGAGYGAGLLGGFTRRQSLNVGAALVAHGEFTIVIAQLAAGNVALAAADRADLTAFAGIYVLATATIGIVLMKESKRLGRRLFPTLRAKIDAS